MSRLRTPWSALLLVAGLLATVPLGHVLAQVLPGSPFQGSGGGAAFTGGAITSPLLLPDGSVAAPPLAFSSATNTGLRYSAGDVMFVIAGVDRLLVNASSFRIGPNQLSFGSALGTDLALQRGGTNGALRIHSGTTPTIAAGCGTAASISGNNTLGTVVIGTAPATCIVTFNGTWTNVPKCFANNRTTQQLAWPNGISTTSFGIGGTIAAGDNIDYLCVSS